MQHGCVLQCLLCTLGDITDLAKMFNPVIFNKQINPFFSSGWAPSTFVSSRGQRATQSSQLAEDFMDEDVSCLLFYFIIVRGKIFI